MPLPTLPRFQQKDKKIKSSLDGYDPKVDYTKTAESPKLPMPKAVTPNEDIDRSWGEAAADTAIGLTQGAVDLVGLPYTAADMISGGALERATGIGKDNLERTGTILDEWKSDALKAKEKEIAETEGFLPTLGAYLDKPQAAVQGLARSAPSMLTPMAAGKAGAAIAAKGLTGKAAQKAAQKGATAGATVGIGATEGLSNAQQSKNEVLGKSHDDLYALSPDYRALVDGGEDPAMAKDSIANEVERLTFAITAPVAIAAGKLTGAAGLEGMLGAGLGKFSGSILPRAAKGAAVESAEEAIQSGGGQLAQNISTQQYVDPNQELLEGVPEAAASGIAVGGLMGAGMGGISKPLPKETQREPEDTPIVDDQGVQVGWRDQKTGEEYSPIDMSQGEDLPMSDVDPLTQANIDRQKQIDAEPFEENEVFEEGGSPLRKPKRTPDQATGFLDKALLNAGVDAQQPDAGIEPTLKKPEAAKEKKPEPKQAEPTKEPKTQPEEPKQNEQQAKKKAEQAPKDEEKATEAGRGVKQEAEADAGLDEATTGKSVTEGNKVTFKNSKGDSVAGEVIEMVNDKVAKVKLDHNGKEVRKQVKALAQSEGVTNEQTETVTTAEKETKETKNIKDDAGITGSQEQKEEKAKTVKPTGEIAATTRTESQIIDDAIAKEPDAMSKSVFEGIKSDMAKGESLHNLVADDIELSQDLLGYRHNGTGNNADFYKSGPLANAAAEKLSVSKAAKNKGEFEAVKITSDQWAIKPVEAEVQETALDEVAKEAATHPDNELPEPTQAQKEAGNYKLAHSSVQGMNISIENPKGSTRKGVDKGGKEWSVDMKDHYGYFKGSVGYDKDHVDTFMGPTAETADTVHVVDQITPSTGKFDEHKVMLGYESEQAAKEAYLRNYDKNWKGLQNITEMSLPDFKEWVYSNAPKKGAIASQKKPNQKEQIKKSTKEFSDKAKAAGNELLEGAKEIYGKKEEPKLSIDYFTNKNGGDRISITGDTQQVKDEIKAIGGAFWSRKSKAWTFAKGKEDTVRKALGDYLEKETVSKGKETGKKLLANSESDKVNDFIKGDRDTAPTIEEVKEETHTNTQAEVEKSFDHVDKSNIDMGQSYKNLLSDIDSAIKDAGKGEKHVYFDVQGDGKFKILNKKENITGFKKRVIKESLAFKNELKDIMPKSEGNNSNLVVNSSSIITLQDFMRDGEYENAYFYAKALNKPLLFYPSGNTVDAAIVYSQKNINGMNVSVVKQYDPKNNTFSKYIPVSSESGVLVTGVDNRTGKPRDFKNIGSAINDASDAMKKNNITKDKVKKLLSDKKHQNELEAEFIKRHSIETETNIDKAETVGARKARQEQETNKEAVSILSGQMLKDMHERAINLPESRRSNYDDEVISRYESENKQEITPEEDKPKTLEDAIRGKAGKDAPIEPKPKVKTKERIKAENDFDKDLAEMGDFLLGLNSMKVVPDEQRENFTRLLTNLMSSAFKLGYVKFKDNAKYIIDSVTNKFGAEAAENFDLQSIQGSYIAMSSGRKDATPMVEVVQTNMDEVNNADYTKSKIDKTKESENVTDDRVPGNGEETLGGVPTEDVGRAESNERTGSGNAKGGTKGKGKSDRANETGDETGRSGRKDTPKPDTVDTRTRDKLNEPKSNFSITDDVELGSGGAGVKYKDNIAAIKLLKELEEENIPANQSEQKMLARYVGWGGLSNAFKNAVNGNIAKGWEGKVKELEGLLTKKELEAARGSTRNAHFTSKPVVDFMWKAVNRLGYGGGNIIEPSMGTGNFLGLMPKGSDAFVTGIELDSITARIAAKLYPESNVINMDFGDVPLPANRYDLAIGNPPFGKNQMTMRHSPQYNKKSIHNQFFLATLDTVRPNGIVAMVVSRYLMDAKNTATREALVNKAELIGAIRMPGVAFKQTAGTEAVTDIVFLRKRSETEKVTQKEKDAWVNTRTIPDPLGGDPMPVNQYYVDNPQMVVGNIDRSGSMQHGNNIDVSFTGDFATELNKKLESLPQASALKNKYWLDNAKSFHEAFTEAVNLESKNAEVGDMYEREGVVSKVVYTEDADGGSMLKTIPLNPDTPWGDAFKIDSNGLWYETVPKVGEDGKNIKQGTRNIYVRKVYKSIEDVSTRRRLGKVGFEKLKGLLGIRDLTKNQIALEASNNPDMEKNRKKLDRNYNAFVKKYGFITEPKNAKTIADMPDEALLMSLEGSFRPEITRVKAKRTGVRPRAAQADKSDIFSRPVAVPPEIARSANTIEDAVAITMADTGTLNLDRIAELLGKNKEDVSKDLLSEGLAFIDPEQNGKITDKNEYLSGNVKRKLNAAKQSNLSDNVKALEKIQPKKWTSDQINPVLGGTWIPEGVYSDFLKHLTGEQSQVRFFPLTNSFDVKGKTDGALSVSRWGTKEYPAPQLLSAVMNDSRIVVSYKDNDGRTIIIEDKTQSAKDKAQEIKDEFEEWVFKSQAQRTQLTELFNDKFNVRVNRQHDGSHMKYPGKVPDSIVQMRRGQNNAVWRGIVEQTVLYDHAVGAGKTFVGIARAMERKRMGLANKPLIVVPNHIVSAWGRDIYKLYPGAKALIPSSKDLNKKNRRRFFARMATGDWDIIVVPHSFMQFLSLSKETQTEYLNEEILLAEAGLKEAQDVADQDSDGETWHKPLSVKQAENLVDKLKSRLKALLAGGNSADKLLTFEQIGIDDVTIDESHEFKNLQYTSSLQNVKGMGTPTGSQKAMDLFFKTKYLHKQKSGISFLTGTPISNSAVEMYNIMRYLSPDLLKELGLEHLDAFRSQFVSVDSAYEPTDSGSGLKRVDRLGREWSNMRALMDGYYSFADVVTNNDIKDWFREDNEGQEYPLPKVKGGNRKAVNVQPTASQMNAIEEIVQGFEDLPNIDDYMERNSERLRLMDRARKISIHKKALDPNSTDEPGGKLDVAADNVKRLYDKWHKDKGTQLVFLDRSIPKSTGDNTIIKGYDKLKSDQAKAASDGNEEAYIKIADSLAKYDEQEIEAMRIAQNNGWNAYQHIKDNLVKQGVPEKEIAFVHSYNTPARKQELFNAVNDGDIRVLIGSTPRMGAGTNVQERLVGLHHVDATWKPSDIEQREGRIIRQGNALYHKYKDFEVEINAYVTERTVDAKLWSLNSTKLSMINAIRHYDGQFEMSFDDNDSVSMSEIAAIASGDPLLLRRFELEGDISVLARQKKAWRRRVQASEDSYAAAERTLNNAESDLDRAIKYDKSRKDIVDNIGNDKRSITIDDDVRNSKPSAKYIIETNEEKGRRFNINGEVVSKTKALEQIEEIFGDTDKFKVEFNGKIFNKRSKYLEEVTKTEDIKDAGTFYGAPIEIDKSDRRVEVSIVIKDGSPNDSAISRSEYIKSNEKASYTAALRGALRSAVAAASSEYAYKKEPQIRDEVKQAEKDIGTFKDSTGEKFKNEAELSEKQAELTRVESQLASQAGEDTDKKTDTKFSKKDKPFKGQSKAQLEQSLKSQLGKYRNINIVGKQSELSTAVVGTLEPGEIVNGLFDPKTNIITLVAENITAAESADILRHETFHKVLVNTPIYENALNEIKAQKVRNTKLYQDAKQAAIDAGTSQKDMDEEIAAYYFQNYRKLPLIKRMVAQFKVYMKQHFNINLNTDDISYLLDEMAKGNIDGGQALPDGTIKFHAVFHGTPHEVDKFSTDKVGVGEGAQAQGWGLYFAGEKGVAEFYRDKLKKEGERGNIYGVELKPTQDEYLDWDKPLTKQSQHVKDAIINMGMGFYISDEMTGNKFYNKVSDYYKPESTDDWMVSKSESNKQASLELLNAGIRGNKYMDNASRTGGQGNDNYVIFSDDDVEITAKFSKKKRVTGTNTTWVEQKGFEGLDEETLSEIAKIGKPPHQPLKEVFKEKMDEHRYRWSNKLRQGLVDQFDSFKSILENKRAWMLANLSGTSHTVVEHAVMSGVPFMDKSGAIDINLDKDSLNDVFKPLGEELDRFMMWVAGNRADRINKESMAAQRKVNILSAEATALKKKAQALIHGNITTEGRTEINELQAEARAKQAQAKAWKKKADVKERLFTEKGIQKIKNLNKNSDTWKEREETYKKVLKGFESIHNDIIKIGVDTGVVSQEDADLWEAQGFYVPFYRLAEDMEDKKRGSASITGLVGQEAYKKLKGADIQLDDLVGNTLMNWNHIISAGLKNQAAAAALEAAEDMGIAESIESKHQGKNSIFVRVDGQEQYYDIDQSQEGDLVLDSLTSLNYEGLNNPAMKVLRKFKRALTIGVTASPEFKVANLLRDTLQAVSVTDMSPNIAKSLIQGFKATSPHSKTIERMEVGGGAFGNSGYIHGADPDAIRAQIKKGVDEMNILTTKSKIGKMFDAYQDFGARLENVNRAANFEQNIAKGMDLLTANFQARDHLDFSRTGSFVTVRAIAQTVPFLNARLQGLDKLGRAALDPKQRKQFLAVVGTYTLASLALYLMMKDDDDYQEAEEWERDTYHLFKIPGDPTNTMYRFPRPFEVGSIANIAERALEQLVDDKVHGKLFAERMWHTISETFAMNPVPQAFKPMAEVWANKNTFTDRSIEGMSMRNLSPVNRKKAWTSQTAIGLSEGMNKVLWGDVVLSPIQIDHLINGYLGWLGGFTVKTADMALRPAMNMPDQPSKRTEDYLLVGRFAREGKARNTKFITSFYENVSEAARAHADVKMYRQDKDFEKADSIIEKNKDILKHRKFLNRERRRISKINKTIRLIIKDRDLDATEKRRKLNKLYVIRNKIAQNAVSRVDQ